MNCRTKLTEFQKLKQCSVISLSITNNSMQLKSVLQSICPFVIKMFFNIFFKRKPLRKPLHCLLILNVLQVDLFISIFVLKKLKIRIQTTSITVV